MIWVLFAALLFPAGFAGYAIGHYTSLGKSSGTVVHTVTIGSTSTPTTTSAETTSSAATTTSSGGGGGSAAAGKAVFAANGCMGQAPPEVLIGVGEVSQIQLLKIRWPTGIWQEFRDVPVNATVRIAEGDAAFTVADSATARAGGR